MLKKIKKSKWILAVLFAVVSTQAFGHGMSEAEKQIIIEGGNLRYIWIGATHMLSGYDHLAFVFGIIFFLTNFKDIVKYITAFTLGHSVTLIFATFAAIQINYFLVDAVIALSVCYIAFHNLDGFKKFLNVGAPNMLSMIVGLGLIHGLGLSTRLQQLPLSEDQLLMNIISFNLGIEVGQISALVLMLLVIKAFRGSSVFPTFTLIANYALILAGVYLFIMQMHGYVHTSHPEEFIVDRELNSQAEKSGEALEPEVLKSPQPERSNVISITVPARGDIEYKVKLKKGETFEYLWSSDGGKLFFDFHGEPAGDTTGYFESFKKSTKSKDSGFLTANFEGTYGWYWKNNTTSPVVVTLEVKGDYELKNLKGVINGAGLSDELTKQAKEVVEAGKNLKTPDQSDWGDTITVTVPAGSDIEYAFNMVKGAKLDYSWDSKGEKLYYDLHGEPAGDTTGYFESLKKGTSSQDAGSLIAPFDGTLGWYWVNYYSSPVVITLKTKGSYERRDI